jgi:hypothetical protein
MRQTECPTEQKGNMTKKFAIVLIVFGLTVAVAAQAPAEKRKTVLDVLKVGQKVALNELQGRYEIQFLTGIDDVQEFTVKAIESDHLVLEDVTEINRLFVPIFSISSIKRMKLKP